MLCCIFNIPIELILTLPKTGELPNHLAYPLGQGCDTLLLQQSYFSSVLLNQKAMKELKTHEPVSLIGHRLCYSTCAWPSGLSCAAPIPWPQKTLGQLIVTKEPVGASSWDWQLHCLMLSLSQSKAAGSHVNELLFGNRNSDQNCFLLGRAPKTKNFGEPLHGQDLHQGLCPDWTCVWCCTAVGCQHLEGCKIFLTVLFFLVCEVW